VQLDAVLNARHGQRTARVSECGPFDAPISIGARFQI
jgi:hypothetical protein